MRLWKSIAYSFLACVVLVAGLWSGDAIWGDAFQPQSVCMGGDPVLLNGMVVTHFLIFFSFSVIPALMIVAISLRPDLFRRWRWLVVLYAAFIFTAGVEHFIDALVILSPRYFLLFLAQFVCAVFSVATVVALVTYYREVLDNVPNVDELVRQLDELEKVVQTREEMLLAIHKLRESAENLSGASRPKHKVPGNHEAS